eukprot:Ihof_evm14s6 gene=Ihof_evmTU14s6
MLKTRVTIKGKKALSNSGNALVGPKSQMAPLEAIPWEPLSILLHDIVIIWEDMEWSDPDKVEAIQPILGAAAKVLAEAKKHQQECGERLNYLKNIIETLCLQMDEDDSIYWKDNLSLPSYEKYLLECVDQLQQTRDDRRSQITQCQSELLDLWDLLELSDEERIVPGMEEGGAVLSSNQVAVYSEAVESTRYIKACQLTGVVVDIHGNSEEASTMIGWDEPIDPDDCPPTPSTIIRLEEGKRMMEEERIKRKRRLGALRDQIRYLCESLSIDVTDDRLITENGLVSLVDRRDDKLTDDFIQLYSLECQRLKAIQREKLKEFVNEAMQQLAELWDNLSVPENDRQAFYAKVPEPFSSEGLDALNIEIIRLRTHLERSRVLYQQIYQRKEFIQKMVDFEKSASEKGRLFGSSVRLLREERFRKTAYPTLLAMEKNLLDGLNEYMEKFDEPFELDGENYLETLKGEISSRALNEEIFGIGYRPEHA